MPTTDALRREAFVSIIRGEPPVWASGAWLSLHSDDPGAAGCQETNETRYEGYTRIRPRAWTFVDGGVLNEEHLVFPKVRSGPHVIRYVGVGVFGTGSGVLLYYGQLSDPLVVESPMSPSFRPGTLVIRP